MTYVITEPCIDVKDGSCVDVCPVDCIHPAEGNADYVQHRQLYISWASSATLKRFIVSFGQGALAGS